VRYADDVITIFAVNKDKLESTQTRLARSLASTCTSPPSPKRA